MTEKSHSNANGGSFDWLEAALRIRHDLSLFESSGPEPAEVSAAFAERCEAAATAALGIARLRRERSRLGFVPLRLSEYLEELARSAKVEIHSLLAASGIHVEGDELGPIPAVARFCRQLGLSVREALVHLGFGLAERLGAPPVPVVLARQDRPGSVRDTVGAYEAALRGTLAEIGATGEFYTLEARLRAAYEESKHAD
ncbi:MAG TPA: hypothetical protein VKM72_09635 [Thermoanaerobaculia bacterium]|nr:hypothetical protein [Thermoanaerobaculia bacterium]